MIRVFLDANILFSAAYREMSVITKLWHMDGVQLVTSPYAVAEVKRNITLKLPGALERLSHLVARVEVVSSDHRLRDDIVLSEKDRPVLGAAIGARCSVLLTGDITHFGRLLGETVEGVRVMTASMFRASTASE